MNLSPKSIDSLKQKLENTSIVSEKAHLMCDLLDVSYAVDSIKAFEYPEKAMEIFQKEKDSFGIARANIAFGGAHFDYNQMKTSEEYFLKGSTILENLLKKDFSPNILEKYMYALFKLSAALGNQGKDDEQIKYLLKIAPLAQKNNDYKLEALINTNLGITFMNLGDNFKAYEYLKNNEKNYQKTTNFRSYATDRLMFANCLLLLDSLKAVKITLNSTKAILDEIPNAPEWHIYYSTLGNYYSKKGKFTAALENLKLSEKNILKNKNQGALKQLYLTYIELFKLQGNRKMEKEYMQSFYSIVRNNYKPLELYALKELAKYEEEEQSYKKAFNYLNDYLLLNDTIQQEELIKEVNQLEQRYQNEKKEREIITLKNTNNEVALKLEKKKSQTYLLYLTAGILLSLLILSYLAIRNHKRKSKLAALSHQQELKRLETEQRIKLYSAMVEAVEKERKRLAIDLHDGLGGRLSGMSLKLSKLSGNKINDKTKTELQDISLNIDDSLKELRTIARNLMPETLLKFGLKAAIEDYCRTINSKNVKIVLQFYDTDEPVNENVLITIYRIIQELINNAIKYSKADEVLVQYFHSNENINLTVEDDGIGFDMESEKVISGTGLKNVKTRVHYLNGKVDIKSKPNQGTTIHIVIDL